MGRMWRLAKIVVICAFVAVGCSEAEKTGRDLIEQNEAGEFTEAGNVWAYDLRVGDCLIKKEYSAPSSGVRVTPCDGAYNGYVFDQLALTPEFGETKPEPEILEERAQDFCANSPDIRLGEITFYYPDDTWLAKKRKITCVAGAAILPRDATGKISADLDIDDELSPLYLEAGDCFVTGSRNSVLGGTSVVTVQDCNGPHLAEAFHRFDLESDAPGDLTIDDKIGEEFFKI